MDEPKNADKFAWESGGLIITRPPEDDTEALAQSESNDGTNADDNVEHQ